LIDGGGWQLLNYVGFLYLFQDHILCALIKSQWFVSYEILALRNLWSRNIIRSSDHAVNLTTYDEKLKKLEFDNSTEIIKIEKRL